jgi:putative transposase
MRRKRDFVEGMFYHVSFSTNNKIRVFDDETGVNIVILTLNDAKMRFDFQLDNFCIMPTHIHLLIKAAEGVNLSSVMQWIKTMSAKRLNFWNNTKDHLWGGRFFSRIIKNDKEFDEVMYYIDQNTVKAGLSASPAEWRASAAFYRRYGLFLDLLG